MPRAEGPHQCSESGVVSNNVMDLFGACSNQQYSTTHYNSGVNECCYEGQISNR